MESSDDSNETETGRIEYHQGNRLLPIHSFRKNVLSPTEVVVLLLNISNRIEGLVAWREKR